MTITEFLLARIAEDEEAARAVSELRHNFDMGGTRQDERFTHDRYLPDSMDGHGNSATQEPATREHFQRWEPARVLAECAAKRAIVKMAQRLDFPCQMRRGKYWDGQRDAIRGVLEELAAVYADHPDFDPAW